MIWMATLAAVARFLAREAELVVVTRAGGAQTTVPRPDRGRLLVFPGSFDPLHEGHTRLADAAADAIKQRDGAAPTLLYELSLKNADKGAVDAAAAEKRLRQFSEAGEAVALTRRALYVDKSELFGPCDFVMGADTASRVLDAKYYGGRAGLETALDALRARGCGFVVAGRLDGGHTFVQSHEALADAPTSYRDMFLEIPDFRVDLSSTELRAAAAAGAGDR
mmetsp:Transcript_26508/g.81501  ORF Transcript_26508/g.81501 Transcript_26508/m.81501 type:complete len:222 (+) Transcript_26508:1522-2187(+)